MDDLHLNVLKDYGIDAGKGNLLGIEPYLLAADYASENTYYTKLDGYISAARDRGWLNARTIIVFPEYVGTWLVATGEGEAVLQAPTTSQAMRPVAARHVHKLIRYLLLSHEQDKLTASLFRTKSQDMVHLYQNVFSRLAKQHNLTVVAGSILLPSPRVVGGVLQAGKGPLFNTSVVYQPDGQAYPVVTKKVYPTQDELPFVTPASAVEIPAYDTPAGRLGVLVCADAWFPTCYERLKALGVQLVVVPSFTSHPATWDKSWGGYSGWPNAPDVDSRDIGLLTEGQAWQKYALAGRITSSGTRQGLNVFLKGSLWDYGAEGRAFIVDGGVTYLGELQGAGIYNLWIRV